MYRSFYQFQSDPFGVLPASQAIYLTETHREALATLVYGVLEKKPFVVILGEVGVGKSTVLQAALTRLSSEPINIVEVSHPLIGPEQVARLLGEAVGVAASETLTIHDVGVVDEALSAAPDPAQRVVFVIDEAQLLPAETLEFIRLISNMAAAREGRLQFLLVGQPEFWTTLQRHEFRHLRQRIAIRCVITPLTKEEGRSYIDFRLQQAGATRAQTMTKGAVTALLAAAHGIPRRINVIADNALLTGFGAGVRPITAKIVQEAIKAVDGAPALPLRISRLGAIAAGLIAVASVAILAAHEWQTWAHFSSAPPAAIAPLSSQQASAAMPTPKAAASRPTATAPAALPTGPLTANLPASAPMAIRPTAPPPPEPGGDKWPPPPGVMAGTNTLPAPGAAPVAAPMVSPRDNVAMATDLAAIPAVPPPFADTRPTDDQAPAKKIQRPMAPPRVLANMRRYRIVHGETVNAILRRFYGKITDDTLSSFIFANPSVKNRDRIIAGSYVLVPASLLQPNTHRSQ